MDFNKPQYRTCQFCANAEDRGRAPIEIFCKDPYKKVILLGDIKGCEHFKPHDSYKENQERILGWVTQ